MKFITKKDVLRRGWTEKMAKEFLPSPTKKITNVYNPETQVSLYSEEEVEAVEQTTVFKESFAKIQEKRNKREKSPTRRQEIHDDLMKLDVKIPVVREEDIVEKAIDFWNRRFRLQDDTSGKKATLNSDEDFLKRVCTYYMVEKSDEAKSAISAGGFEYWDIDWDCWTELAMDVMKDVFKERLLKANQWMR